MTEQESTRITSRTTMTDALLELYRSFFNKEKNKYLSEIQNPEEADLIAVAYVEAELFNDTITEDYLDKRTQIMLTLDRQNAKMLVNLVKTNQQDTEEEPDKNIGVKKELENLLSSPQ